MAKKKTSAKTAVAKKKAATRKKPAQKEPTEAGFSKGATITNSASEGRFRLYRCPRLELTAGNIVLVGEGQITLDVHGRLEVTFHVIADESPKLTAEIVGAMRPPVTLSLSGMTTHGWSVRALVAKRRFEQDLLPRRDTFRLVVVRNEGCDLQDAARQSTSWTRRVFWFADTRVRGSCSRVFEIDGLAWQVRSPPSVDGRFVQIVVENRALVTYDRDAQQERITKLLRLAMRSPTSMVCEEVFVGDTPVAVRLVSALRPGSEPNQVPLVDPTCEVVAAFLQNALPGYFGARRDYGVDTLVEYYWRIHAEGTAEVKAILASVLMEAFKFHFANRLGPQQTPPISGHRGASGTVKWFYKLDAKGKKVRQNFKDLLVEAAGSVGMRHIDTTFIDERNALFHSGATVATQTSRGDDFAQTMRPIVAMLDTTDELLLRSLGYVGEYASWWGGGKKRLP